MDWQYYTARHRERIETLLHLVFNLLMMTTALWFGKVGYQFATNQGFAVWITYLIGFLSAYIGAKVIDGFGKSAIIYATNSETESWYKAADKKDNRRRFVLVNKRIGFTLLFVSGMFTLFVNYEIADWLTPAPPTDIVETRMEKVNQEDAERSRELKSTLASIERQIAQTKKEKHRAILTAIESGSPSYVDLWKSGNGWIRSTNDRRKYGKMIEYREGILAARQDSINSVEALIAKRNKLEGVKADWTASSAMAYDTLKVAAFNYQNKILQRADLRDRMIFTTLAVMDVFWMVLIFFLVHLLRLAGFGIRSNDSPYSALAIVGRAGLEVKTGLLALADHAIDFFVGKSFGKHVGKPSVPRGGAPTPPINLPPPPVPTDEDDNTGPNADDDPTPTPTKDPMPDDTPRQQEDDESDTESSERQRNRNPDTKVLDGEVVERKDNGEIVVRHTVKFANGTEQTKEYNLRKCSNQLSSYRSKERKYRDDIAELKEQISKADGSERSQLESKLVRKINSLSNARDKMDLWQGYIDKIHKHQIAES